MVEARYDTGRRVAIDAGRSRQGLDRSGSEVCEPRVLGFEPPFNKAIVVDLDACTGCRHCEWLCPDWAIVVRERAPAPAELQP